MARTAAWEQTVTELVRERGDALLRYALMLCGDREDAADLVQDALARTFGRLRNGFGVDSAEAYVRRAILNASLDRGRRASRWRRIAPLEYRPDEVEPPSEGTDRRIDLHDELQKLSPRERACLVLRYYDDLKVDDIAARLGISAGAVKRYLSDGLARMALALADDYVPETRIDDARAIRDARARRAPKTALAGTFGGLAAIAAIVPLAFGALPPSVSPLGTAGGAADSAVEERAGGGDDADSLQAERPALLIAMPPITAAGGAAIPVGLELASGRDEPLSGRFEATVELTVARDGVPLWSGGPAEPLLLDVDVPPGRPFPFATSIPPLPPGDYELRALVTIVGADGEPVRLGASAPLHVE